MDVPYDIAQSAGNATKERVDGGGREQRRQECGLHGNSGNLDDEEEEEEGEDISARDTKSQKQSAKMWAKGAIWWPGS